MSAMPISGAEEARPTRIRLGPGDLMDGRDLLPVSVGRLHLLLVRGSHRLVATERACPHEGADLALGRCAGNRLFCPRHLASFSLQDGSISTGWSFRRLRLYRVEASADGLWLLEDGLSLER